METSSFPGFLEAVRAQQTEAVAEFLRRYEPLVRRLLHRQLNGSHLRRTVDSSDLWQSILKDFLAKLHTGQFAFRSEADLRGLLVVMARHKLASRGRHERRNAGSIPDSSKRIGRGPPPDEEAAHRDDVEVFRKALTGPERTAFDLRAAGQSWEEIGRELGCNADAARMRLQRAVARVQRRFKEPGAQP
jgi:RNA polymerase sigma factor (sigma-70 family)